MHNLDNVVDFIEKFHKIKLFEYQKKMLQLMIEGKTFSSPVGSGRKTMLKGYTEFLNKVYGKHVSFYETEEHIKYEEVIEENNTYEKFLQSNNFIKEYHSEWKS